MRKRLLGIGCGQPGGSAEILLGRCRSVGGPMTPGVNADRRRLAERHAD
jgi:hypothetical protein